MLGPMRFGPVVTSGRAKHYPVWWIGKMPTNCRAFQQLLMVRSLYPRIKDVLGRQWTDEIKESCDYRYYHDEMNAFISCWEDKENQEKLKELHNEINFQEAYDQMKSMLDEFEPMWEDDREWGDYADDETPQIINNRTLEERLAAKSEVEMLYRDLEALRVSIDLVV